MGGRDRQPIRWRKAPRGFVPVVALEARHVVAGRAYQPLGR